MAASRRTRELGQNFLRDPNILGVIERAAELSPEDVVLEVGGGEGVLSARLARRVRRLHVVEVDERLREPLGAALAGQSNVDIHWGDAMKLDLAALRPRPDKLVANLPYGIAATLLLRTIEELPSIALWLAMIQREVGLRLAASPGAGDYGASSVLAQLAGEVTIVRPISRTVFSPVPNVDSVLLRIRRTAPAPP
ncbi:MAG TPA: 16S rRNA (adenine(1518)-N(6)/adenine(1519)-N(6))-dimethyltransferase RsmA, partial [Solirubrobacteraceae bacterium]|nr:16S rRNA (adenine(1518)-N(6)/adenine(1519)-N(6))-dimethyltransferase RsmA [Solirubrobacteraceae bacterium]